MFLLPHIPKCAGSTVERHLERHLGPGFWSPAKRSRILPLGLFGRKWQDRPPGPAEGIRAVSGHFMGASIADLFPGRTVRRMLILREPGALVLSWYNYRMMRYRSLGQGGYAFRLHLASLPVDPVAHFLLERWCELPWARIAAMRLAEKRARLEAALSGFDRIADIAAADALLAGVSRALGIPEAAAPENTSRGWTAGTGWRALAAGDLLPSDRARLEDRIRLDRWLWERFAMGRDAAPPAHAASFLAGELGRAVAEPARRRAKARPPAGPPAC